MRTLPIYLTTDGLVKYEKTDTITKTLYDTKEKKVLTRNKTVIAQLNKDALAPHLKIIESNLKRVVVPGLNCPHRVMTPEEVGCLIDELKYQYKKLFKVLLLTGMRYPEVFTLHKYPRLFTDNKNFIRMPSYKTTATMGERNIILNKVGIDDTQDFIDYYKESDKEIPKAGSWVDILRRASKKAGLPPVKAFKYECKKGSEQWEVRKSKLVDGGKSPNESASILMKDTMNHKTFRFCPQLTLGGNESINQCPICGAYKLKRVGDWYDASWDAWTTRRSYENWLMKYYPNNHGDICKSFGHNIDTANAHYKGDGFNKEEVDDMKPYVKDWVIKNGGR